MLISNLLNPLFDLFFPNLCLICGEGLVTGERQLCLACLQHIPKTNFHRQHNNPVEQRFYGKVEVERASAYFFFEKGSEFQQLIHELKYRGNREVGVLLGKYAAADLSESADFMRIDAVIPVPLHKKKEAKRGYNQSEMLAKGMAEVMDKPMITNNLHRKVETETQTRKSVYERFENTRGIFGLNNPAALAGKHILLVDDVLTTGSTLEACIHALRQAADVKVSVFALATAM